MALAVCRSLGHACAQVAFVPLKAGGAEDEGVLVTIAYEPSEMRSYVVVVDAQSMQMSARIALPQRVPFGFHCTFVPE
jgi:carotenoid cleavage dioxygenase